MPIDVILFRITKEWLVLAMKLLNYLFVSDSISRTLLKKSFIRVLFIVKFLEVTATILKLNVATIFHLAVQVGLNLALTPL